MKWISPFICLLLWANVSINAQLGNFCKSHEIHEQLLETSPEYAEKAAKIQKVYLKALQYVEDNNSLHMATYNIPVVFHVMHNSGDAVGSGTNISLARIQTEIDNWNDAFNNIGVYAGGPDHCACGISSAAVDINFVLATQDPLGFPTEGVTRFPITNGSPLYRLEAGPDYGSTLDLDIQALIGWDTESYLNVWVVDNLCDVESGGTASSNCSVAGFAYFPSASGEYFDGSVVQDDYIGVSTNLSKVMVHELGHYLNLSHTFNGGCSETDCTSGGDFVCDTPPDNSTGGVNCFTSSTANTCSNDATITNSPFSSDVNDMYENYMDYGFQECQNTFTPNQKTRMEAVLMPGGGRNTLTASTGAATPTVTNTQVAFSMDARTSNEGITTGSGTCEDYRDILVMLKISQNPSGNVTLTFNKAGTATEGRDYTLTNSSVTFSNGGDLYQYATIRIFNDALVEGNETIILTYNISGSATAAAANQTMTITIKDDDTAPGLVVFTEDFESGGVGWIFSSFGGNTNWWTVGPNAGLSGSSAAYITDNTSTKPLSYDNTANDNPVIFTPLVDGTAASGSTMSFTYKADGSGNDIGRIIYRIGGNGNFTFLPNTYTNNGSGANTASFTLPGIFDNQSYDIGFWWVSNGDGIGANPPFAVDNISISTPGPAVESSITSTSEYLGGNETAYFYSSDGDLIAKIENTSSHNYGCTTLEIDRSGTGATNGAADYSTYPFLDKTYRVTPTTNNPTGSYNITLYYTEAEVAGWENSPSAGTNNRANLTMVKSSGSISSAQSANSVAVSPTQGSYGSDWAYTTSFSSGFSGFGLGDISSGALPLDLIDFSGVKNESSIQLDWLTENEMNTSHFEVERSLDNRNFESIGNVNAKGFSKNDYQLIDKNPIQGVNYYRLKMIDLDETIVYSKVISFEFKNDLSVDIRPNPTHNGAINLLINSLEEGEMNIEIYDVRGALLLHEQSWIEAGTSQNKLKLNDLAKGVYFLRVQRGRSLEVIRFVND